VEAREAVRACADALRRAGFAEASLEAELLVAHALGVERVRIRVEPERALGAAQERRMEELLRRRLQHEPIAYLLGEWEFFSLPLRVDASVLVPRPETELLVERGLACLGSVVRRGDLRVLDLGTGSGAIAVALAYHEPRALVLATDVSLGALRLARGNALRHGVAHRVRFLRGDLLSPLARGPARFDLVVSNPPYVTDEEWERVPRDVREHEPRTALRSGPDPFAFHRRIAPAARALLRPGGWLLMECAAGQAIEPSAAWLEGYDEVGVEPDGAGRERLLAARRVEVRPPGA